MTERLPRSSLTRTVAISLIIAAPILLVVLLFYASTRPYAPNAVVRCDAHVIGRGQMIVRLTQEQCEDIGRNVALGGRETDVKVLAHEAQRLLLKTGDRPPDNTNLKPLPDEVLSQHPSLRKYQYFIVEDEIALTDPSNGLIVAVVEVHRNH